MVGHGSLHPASALTKSYRLEIPGESVPDTRLVGVCADGESKSDLKELTVASQRPGLTGGREPVYRIPGYRVALVPDETAALAPRRIVDTRAGWARLVASYYTALAPDREVLLVVFLSTRYRVLGISVVAVGSLNRLYAPFREVLKGAALAGASSIVVAHNHPSGEPTPSDEDRDLSQRLAAAGELLGIRVLDHIVVGDRGRWRSVPMRRPTEPVPTQAAPTRAQVEPREDPPPAARPTAIKRGDAATAIGKSKRSTEGRAVAMVHLDADRVAWLRTQGDDFGATLRRLLDAEILRAVVKKAISDEHHVEMLIRRHAQQLGRRLLPAERQWTDEETALSRQLDDQAEREILAACGSMEDANMRAAAERVVFRRKLDSGAVGNKKGRGRLALTRLRERRPGGWR